MLSRERLPHKGSESDVAHSRTILVQMCGCTTLECQLAAYGAERLLLAVKMRNANLVSASCSVIVNCSNSTWPAGRCGRRWTCRGPRGKMSCSCPSSMPTTASSCTRCQLYSQPLAFTIACRPRSPLHRPRFANFHRSNLKVLADQTIYVDCRSDCYAEDLYRRPVHRARRPR